MVFVALNQHFRPPDPCMKLRSGGPGPPGKNCAGWWEAIHASAYMNPISFGVFQGSSLRTSVFVSQSHVRNLRTEPPLRDGDPGPPGKNGADGHKAIHAPGV